MYFVLVNWKMWELKSVLVFGVKPRGGHVYASKLTVMTVGNHHCKCYSQPHLFHNFKQLPHFVFIPKVKSEPWLSASVPETFVSIFHRGARSQEPWLTEWNYKVTYGQRTLPSCQHLESAYNDRIANTSSLQHGWSRQRSHGQLQAVYHTRTS